MACFSIASWSFLKPQLAHISECTMYWLIAVNSSASRSFRIWMTFGLPFMAAPNRMNRLDTVPG